MQRTTAVTVGLLFVLGVALVFVLGRTKSESKAQALAASTPSVASALASASASTAPSATPSGAPSASSESGEADAYDTLPDGRKAPPLPESAPNLVAFGVIVFTYDGAQSAPSGARSKSEAKKKATDSVAEAQRDFAAAVAKGDRGSTADAGRVPRGVLEPAVEYLLFTTKAGEVYPEAIETPRGFWVVRRNR